MGLAERIGVPHQRVCDYECGRYAPQWRTLVRLVEVLGVGVVRCGRLPASFHPVGTVDFAGPHP
jgi:hypothetical protein